MNLPEYIIRSIGGAFQFVRINHDAVSYLDQSSDGFWKSFWAIGVMAPFFALQVIYGSGQSEQLPILSEGIYFVVALPFTAFVMAYFTKYMNISAGYASMVVAYNWLSALTYGILVTAQLILSLFASSAQFAYITMAMLGIYFGLYVVWFMFKLTLKISGVLAFGVLLFELLLTFALKIILFRVFDPEIFERVYNTANNLPS